MVVGPVLYTEMLLSSRRGRYHIFRYIYAGWLVVQFIVAYGGYYGSWLIDVMGGPRPGVSGGISPAASFASGFLRLLVVQQWLLMALVVPAITAGAITDEKERRTLEYLFTAGLTAGEITIGKMLGRLALVATVFLPGLPLLAFVSVFAGVSLSTVLVLVLQAGVLAIGIAAASVLVSVWTRQTRDAVIGFYAIAAMILSLRFALAWLARHFAASAAASGSIGVALLSGVDSIAELFSPYYALAPMWSPSTDELWNRLGLHTLAWGGFALVCLTVAAWRMRPAYLRQLENVRKRRRWLPAWSRPPIGDDPIRWRERYVVGLAPFPWLRFLPRRVMLVLFGIFCWIVAACFVATSAQNRHLVAVFSEGDWRGWFRWLDSIDPDVANPLTASTVVVAAIIASLVVGIRCSGAITGEREKGTWEALLLTPLETRTLVRSKLWGVIGSTYLYLILYAIPFGLFSALVGPGAVVMFLLWLAVTWLAMFYVGAAGLWCSARSPNSWRSLVGVLGYAYVGGFFALAFLTPVLSTVYMVILIIVWLIELLLFGTVVASTPFTFSTMLIATSIVLAGAALFGSWFFLREAERRIADLERTRHWHNEPTRRPRVTPPQVIEYKGGG